MTQVGTPFFFEDPVMDKPKTDYVRWTPKT